MPRKTRTKSLLSHKPSLQFVEPPLDGARYHHVPEVRGALNPKSFLFDEQQQSSTASSSWVTPQFEQLPPSVPRGRRGRKTCISASNILDRSSQLLRKSSVCKFPSLSFERRSSAQPLRRKRADVKNAFEFAVRGPQSVQVHEIGSLSNQLDTKTPKLRTSLRERTTDRRRLSEVTPEGEASTSGRCVEFLTTPGNVARPTKSPAICTAVTPVSATNTPDKDNVFSPPDVETPELHHNGSSSSFLRFLLPPSQPPSPPHCLILAADTPERDYGVKVTWRRRKGLMRLLRDRGNLSNAEALFSIQ
ncbi:RAD9, HUS1, RAD1-interacting nuclear orphan protein 1 [Esox lucius]|uniref:Uncharacterized protein n=1 Tax=Esox lucius TaxID=8010 RepID=A0A3P8ZBQ6_ESOLU|nr:RAD9, HUS1, RAD1-interacting nuclear orphan protein 1 [Esox lucius]XP_019898599.2 RAD9, HUS1, RAD1-interacting nuclear orphan protein 1 [Esox lucius]XP_019898600.2 RAD9, HUS1, RAD1-interacting nuclear orphan protein 1 [Esox lucius]